MYKIIFSHGSWVHPLCLQPCMSFDDIIARDPPHKCEPLISTLGRSVKTAAIHAIVISKYGD